MAWRGVTVMDQRVRFISEYLEGYFKIAERAVGERGTPDFHRDKLYENHAQVYWATDSG